MFLPSKKGEQASMCCKPHLSHRYRFVGGTTTHQQFLLQIPSYQLKMRSQPIYHDLIALKRNLLRKNLQFSNPFSIFAGFLFFIHYSVNYLKPLDRNLFSIERNITSSFTTNDFCRAVLFRSKVNVQCM